MVKKVSFYLLLILILIFFQLYTTPFFFIYALPILFWMELGSKEVYIFLIAAILLDLLSSFYFGFWFVVALLVFFSSNFILKQYLREWTTMTFVVIFSFWQIAYGLFYIILSKTSFSWYLLVDLVWSLIICIIIFMLFGNLKKWLIDQDIINVSQDKDYRF